MKIQIDADEFKDLAEKLGTTPENVVRIFLDHAKNIPHVPVILDAVQPGRSLDSALEKLIQFAEPAYTLGEIIENIVGGHEYMIEDGGYSLENGIIYFEIGFPVGTDLSLSSLTLQFGADPGLVATNFVEVGNLDVDLEDLKSEIWDKIDMYDAIEEDDHIHLNLEHDEDLVYSLQIDTPGRFLDLPKIDPVDKVMKKIKEIILSHVVK